MRLRWTERGEGAICVAMSKRYESLRDFIATLEKRGELVRVTEPVSTHLEMTEIQTRLLAEGGPAVLFENVYSPCSDGAQRAQNKNDSTPVLVNLFGTVNRVAMGMGRTPDELREVGETLAFLKQPEPPSGLKDAWDKLPLLKTAMNMKPKTVKKAPCQEVVLTGDDVDLSRLPIQTCWPGEPAPLITWPLVVTASPSTKRSNATKAYAEWSAGHSRGLDEEQKCGQETASFSVSHREGQQTVAGEKECYNLGIYRMQVTGQNTTLMRWLKHRGGAQHHAQASEPLPAAAVIGADPATILAAVTPVPETMSEYDFAGLLRGKGVELVDCKTVPLKVPAHAEIVLEGYVSLTDYGDEGPYGDHTGYYNSVEPFPVFTVTAITMRKNPIYLSTFTGRPPDEPSVLGEALNEVFIPLIQQQFPEIVDFWLPPEGCSYRIAVVSIKKGYAGHAKRVMMGVWSFLRQFLYTKFVIVVDDDINVRDWKDVMWAISTRMDPVRDTLLVENTPIDYLDFASPESGLGGKMGMDATNKLAPETHREWGQKICMDDDVIQQVTDKWEKYGLPGSGKDIWGKK